MVTARWWLLVVLAGGCGNQPLLKNVPQPPAGQAAGVAGLAAAAATLADPDGAVKKGEKAQQEQQEHGAPPPQGIGATAPIPAAVLDRLDQAQAVDAGVGAADGGASPR